MKFYIYTKYVTGLISRIDNKESSTVIIDITFVPKTFPKGKLIAPGKCYEQQLEYLMLL